MDVDKKKQEVLEDIARQPANVVFARIGIADEIQLADLMKEQFIPKLREAANTSHSNTDSLHEVCTNLAKQRALLQGAAITDILSFNIDDGNATTRANGTAAHNQKGDLSFPALEDASYSNKTSLPFVVLHDLNEDGGSVTLSSTSNANTTIANDEGESIKYFTDFSKYFLTRSRANGEIISIDENTAPYTTPTTAEPFFPANTINGEIFRGDPTDPTANSDVRHEFSLTANTTAVGFAGANNDITENKFVGNTYVVLKLSNATGTFSESENLLDFDNNSATIKTQANTTTVVLESGDVKGTFTSGEIISDGFTNATVSSITTGANTSASITLTGNTFVTGGNTDVTLGFSTANSISIDDESISRTGSTITVIANNHGINSGDRVVLKGADDAFSEFNDTFIVTGSSTNTLQFETANSVSVVPTGSFSLIKNIFFGRTSNASGSVTSRTVNATAELRFQSSNLSVGFPVGNTVTGESSTASGFIDERTTKGDWYQVKTNEVKTYYAASDSGTWGYDATNNANGIETTANTGEFWLKNFEMVRINQLVASSGTGSSLVAPKMVLDIALATSTDTSGGYDSSIRTQNPGVYFAYPLKTYEDQVHDGTITLEAFNNFASVVIAPEGLEINFDWKPVANSSGVAINNTHLHANGDSISSDFTPEKVTVLNKSDFNGHLGSYNSVATANSTGGFPNAQDDIFLSSIADNRSSGAKDGTNQYLSVNANPFFPAVGGTHKEVANTQNDITGTQPGGLTANDIYAGAYTEIQVGATEPSGDFRYRIWNDIKWTYGTNPHATGASKTNAYNVPRANAFLEVYDGEFDTELEAIEDQDSVTAGSISTSTEVRVLPESDQTVSGTAGNYTVFSVSGGMFVQTPHTVAASGTGFTDTAGSTTNHVNVYNRVQFLINKTRSTNIGGTSGNYTVNDMETNFGLLYQLLKNLEASHGKDYDDPLEPSTAGYATGQSDASFKQETEDLKTSMDNLISAHNTQFSSIGSHSFAYSGAADNSYTIPTSYVTTLNTFLSTELPSYRNVIKRRITEISNRIGYVNSKDVAGGGTTSSPAKSVSGTNEGFQGYSYNSGNGYANTIYSHANFLAGKKVKLVENILKAIEDVEELYKQIKTKRSEYYVYNQ